MFMRFEHCVAASLDLVFRFHENPANLTRLHAKTTGLRLLHHDGNVMPGTTTWFEQTIGRTIPLVLGFRHTRYEPPFLFAEELIHGPFKQFTHTHEFATVHGGTLVRDILEVELSWVFGGSPATRLFVAPQLAVTFAQRREALESLASSGALVSENVLHASTRL
jgi:ligand-binding SRPBCC domain-containing protein